MNKFINCLILGCLLMSVFQADGQVLMDDKLKKSIWSLNHRTYQAIPPAYYCDNVMNDSLLVKRIQKLEGQLRKLKPVGGSVGLKFNSFNNFRENKYQFGGDASLSVKEYPYQLRLSSDIEAVIENGELSDRVTNLGVDFDFHPLAFNSKKENRDPLKVEMYVFLNRNDNTYLNIKNRFQTGTGVIVGFWGKKIETGHTISEGKEDTINGSPVDRNNSTIYKHLTSKGGDIMSFLIDSLGAISMSELYEKETINSTGEATPHGLESKISDLVSGGKNKTQLSNISKEIDDYIAYTRKTENKFRIAMLFGVNYEYEESFIKDSISTFSMDTASMEFLESREVSTVEDLPIIARFYGVLRPSLMFTNGNFKIYARSYLKFALNNHNADRVSYQGDEGSMESINYERATDKQFLYDFRVNSIIRISYSTPLNRKKSYTRNFGTKFEVSIGYNFDYDNAPRRTWVYYPDVDTFDKLRAPRMYSAVKFGFKFTV